MTRNIKGTSLHAANWTSVFFCKLLLNGASHDTKIGFIRLVWAGNKKYKFSFLLCAGPLTCLVLAINKLLANKIKKKVRSRIFKDEALSDCDRPAIQFSGVHSRLMNLLIDAATNSVIILFLTSFFRLRGSRYGEN